jgi:prolycopene isomerase
MKDSYDVIIIGAGMGGLTCGAWLTHMGMKVLVLEQNTQVGGCCSSYKREGFNFTPAASIITGTTKKDGVFEHLINRLGISIPFIPLNQGYHVNLPDFDYYLYSGGDHAREQLIEQLIRIFPHEAQGIKAFFAKLGKLYAEMDYATFFGTGPKDIARILLKCRTLLFNMGKGILPFVDDFVKDPKLKTVLSINSTCCNLPPSQMSLLGIAGLLLEGGLSNPHVAGGAIAVPEAFASYIRSKGGDVALGSQVDKIFVENRTATGVRAIKSQLAQKTGYGEGISDLREFKAKYIVSNAAARQTFMKLVGADKLPEKFGRVLGRQLPTPPFCALFLGLDMDLKSMGLIPALHIHSSNYDTDEHFRNIDAKILNESGPPPFFRFQLAPLSDPSSAPQGKTAFVMHAIPAPVSGWEKPGFEQKVAAVMIKRAEKIIPGLSQKILYQEFWSPVTINKYLLCGADASMGWALSPQQVGPKRLAQQTPIKNLLLSGHWTAPAVGVMSTVVSGLQAARMVLKAEGVKEPLADIGIVGGVKI